MSGHQRASDRGAAFTGLILGVVALGIVIYSIVSLTNKHYAAKEGTKAAAGASQ
ncbi:MAG: hypothetical protein ACHQQ3_06240 [Gemmatimonadales bacterium]